MYKLLPLPSIFAIDEVQLAYIIMGRSGEIENAIACCDSANSKIQEGTYMVDFLEEKDAIVRVFMESLFGLDTIVGKNYLGQEAARGICELFKFNYEDIVLQCEALGLLAIAAYISEEEPWRDYCKLVDKMAASGATGLVLCAGEEFVITTGDAKLIEESMEESQVRDRILYMCEFFQEKNELAA